MFTDVSLSPSHTLCTCACLTEPGDVFIVPVQSLLAGWIQNSATRHPPERVHMSSSVKISSAQQTQATKAFLSYACVHMRAHTHTQKTD